MSLLTTTEVIAAGADGGLDTTALQAVIDREEAEIVRRYGAHTAAITESVQGGGRSIFTKKAISSISSVTEYLYPGDTLPYTLAATDYYVWSEEGRIERVVTSSCWSALVTVVYTPVDDTSLRKSVLMELIRLAVEGEASSGGSVSALGFSVSSRGGANGLAATSRAAQYARLGWLS